MPRALVLGGTGAIGLAIARRLLSKGWDVDLTGRDPHRLPADIAAAGGRLLVSERGDRTQLPAAVGSGVDLLVDCVCFTAADALTLREVAAHASSTVMISSKAVYADAAGNHSNSDVPPRFDGPISESEHTVAPGNGDYDSPEGYGRNKVAAEHVLLESDLPVTVLRPSKVHGAGARRPREWVFVKRVLDQRRTLVLARPSSVDHTTAAANIAALVEVVAAQPGTRILNCADPDAPTALEISRAVAAHLGHQWEEVLVDDSESTVGRHPWDVAHPIVLDTTASTRLGYRAVGDYATTVRAALDWLVACAAGGPDAPLLPPADDPFFAPLLDYAAEDELLRARPRRRG